jgi:hypothetical protein
MIAEAQNAEAFGFDRGRARSVCLLSLIGEMLPSIKLDHQFRSMADEVGDVVFDRNLSSEAGSAQAVVTEFRPQNSFGIGRILSEYACVRAQPGGDFPGWFFRLVH